MERKRSVEMRLEQQRKEREEYEAMLQEKQNRDLRRAQSMKETKEQETIQVIKQFGSLFSLVNKHHQGTMSKSLEK